MAVTWRGYPVLSFSGADPVVYPPVVGFLFWFARKKGKRIRYLSKLEMSQVLEGTQQIAPVNLLGAFE